MLQTSMLIAIREKDGVGEFDILQDGIKKIKLFVHTSNYHIENAIVDSAKAAYISTCIRKGATDIEKYTGNLGTVLGMIVVLILTSKLNKPKRTLPEAFCYWVKTNARLRWLTFGNGLSILPKVSKCFPGQSKYVVL